MTTLYNTNALPRWDGTNTAPQPVVSNNKGYDVTTMVSPARRELAYKRANANLCDGIFWWPMFVTDIGIDLALSGSRAQSRLTRDFYPHNFTQPSFVVQGQSLDQRDYGALTDFVHYTQRNSLQGGKLVQLFVDGKGIDGGRTHGRGVVKNGKRFTNQGIRGSHQTILCQGYVNKMPRQHQRGVFSPTYSFSFVVADMIAGPYHEDIVQVQQQMTWVDILKSTETFKVNQALLKENNKVLGWAKNNSSNILSSG